MRLVTPDKVTESDRKEGQLAPQGWGVHEGFSLYRGVILSKELLVQFV